jgi:hypothetical protein
MIATISTHMKHVKEKVKGVKYILSSFPGRKEFTVDQVKEYYEQTYGTPLKGNSFTNWINVEYRGMGWDFAEKVSFHNSCCMLSFHYVNNNKLYLRNGNYLKYTFR